MTMHKSIYQIILIHAVGNLVLTSSHLPIPDVAPVMTTVDLEMSHVELAIFMIRIHMYCNDIVVCSDIALCPMSSNLGQPLPAAREWPCSEHRHRIATQRPVVGSSRYTSEQLHRIDFRVHDVKGKACLNPFHRRSTVLPSGDDQSAREHRHKGGVAPACG